LPDMKLPIQYALSYPNRLSSRFPRFDFMKYPTLSFEKPDTNTFRCLPLAFEALRQGGNMSCILNAANEVVVRAFLHDQVAFTAIPDILEKAMQRIAFIGKPSYADYVETDQETRLLTSGIIGH
jgi:1-deoxy-D-xylulose-5-phosphate reductoisomerase